MTPTSEPCHRCGGKIEGFYAVLLCDDCLEAITPEQPCHGCGAVSKHHPRMTRCYGDQPWSKNEPRYYCADCSNKL
jgi:hypothetical protein